MSSASATATQTESFDHDSTQRKVRSPLQTVRAYIRRYIILEGVALIILCISTLFWLGLALDFGLYQLYFEGIGFHGVDWVQELNDFDPSGVTSVGIRLVLLVVVLVGLSALGFTKVVLRWLRDFNDRAVALVLERRFPKQLGDRLITAIELADPMLSKKYGFSQAMVERTILEAVAALKKLPVSGVFNWSRLVTLWILVGVSTVGLLLASMLFVCAGTYAFADKGLSPIGFGWRFFHVGSIWAERNLLLQSSYWPRRTYLEIERFQPSEKQPRIMRIPGDEPKERKDLQVRAYQYVVADRTKAYGWRPLYWQDLHRFVDQAMLDRVRLPETFEHWQVDPDELEPNLVDAVFSTDVRVRPAREIRAYLAELDMLTKQPDVKLDGQRARALRAIRDLDAKATLEKWLDWRQWTMDKLLLQMENESARPMLRDLANGQDNYSYLEEVYKQLDELADAPSMYRTFRKLDIPTAINVRMYGLERIIDENASKAERMRLEEQDIEQARIELTGVNYLDSFDLDTGNKYSIPLDSVKDSTFFRFRVFGRDFATPNRYLELVSSPTPATIKIDKDEPAYIYHRLRGPDQTPLRGHRHLTRDYDLPTSGDVNSIDVPTGADLVIRVATDRPLRKDQSLSVEEPAVLEAGFDIFKGKVTRNKDGSGFSIEMPNVTRKHEFTVKFHDVDNIRGKRRFRVQSTFDVEPQIGNLNVYNAILRKPKFKAPTPSEKDKDGPARDFREQAELANSFLITPDARLPFECPVKDDYGLVAVGYHYKVRKVDFELVAGGGSNKKLPSLEIDQAARRYHAAWAVSNFQYWPGNPQSWHFGPLWVAQSADHIAADVRQSQGFKEGFVMAERFEENVRNREAGMIFPNQIAEMLTKRRTAQSWEFEFSGDEGFDVQKYLNELKSVDIEKGGQLHFALEIGVQATDNNVETGQAHDLEYRDPETGKQVRKAIRGSLRRNKNGYVKFIVVSENELLSQIALEEETLFEKLESAKDLVDNAVLSLSEQSVKTRDPNTDMDNLLIRMNEIRTALGTSGNKVRDVHKAYENIVREMKVNRVKSSRMSRIQDSIFWPLDSILVANPAEAGSGSSPRAEDAFGKVISLIEEEHGFKRKPDGKQHALNINDADRQMRKLSFEIRLVLDAMSEGIVESKLIALIAELERIQRDKTRLFNQIYLDIVQKELENLLKDDLTPKKEQPKLPPEKTSQLNGTLFPSLSAGEGHGHQAALGRHSSSNQPSRSTCSIQSSQLDVAWRKRMARDRLVESAEFVDNTDFQPIT